MSTANQITWADVLQTYEDWEWLDARDQYDGDEPYVNEAMAGTLVVTYATSLAAATEAWRDGDIAHARYIDAHCNEAAWEWPAGR